MNIQEIRQQYPQYEDLSDDQLASSLHAKFYSDMPYSDFASKVGVQAKRAADQPKERSTPDSIARQIGLTARAGIGAIAAIPNMVADPLVGIANKMGADLPVPSEALDRTLTRAGFPEPASGTERFSNAVVKGGLQPPMMAAAKMIPAARMGTQIASAAAGAGGSDLAQEAGLGPMGQLVAGLTTGIAVPASMAATGTAAKAAGRMASGIIAPMTEAGRKEIAARILQQNASNPEAAAASIQSAPRYVPGVNPLTAELADDAGVSALSKNLRNQNPAVFADAEAANDAARQAALQRSFGTATDVQLAEQARDDITKPLREAAFAEAKKVDTRPILNTAKTVTKSGAGARQEVERAMSWVQSRLKGENDPERIYAIRQDINDIIAGKMRDPEKASYQLAAGQLKAVKAVLDKQLEKAAPGFNNYLKQYADRSTAIGAMETGQGIIQGARNPLTERLSPAAYARAMENKAEDVAKTGAIGSDALYRVNADLKRSVAPTTATKTAGSDTLQNMVGSEVLQRALGSVPGGPITRMVSRGASMLLSPFEQQTRGLLAQSMVDPELAAGLLRKELKKNPDLLRQLLDLRTPVSYGGLLGTMGANQ